MEQLLQQGLDFVFGLSGPVVWALMGLLTWAEAAFFLGLVTPGEIAMVVGGALATRGQVALAGVAAAAATGTITGNVTGYWLGRRWGSRLLDWAPLQRLAGRYIDSARAYFERRGEWAVVVGQFVSYVRIFVPFLAGATGMPFRRYVVYAVPVGIVWAAAWVLGGFVLGESWGMLRGVAGPAAFLVLVLVLLALAIRWVAIRVAHRGDRVRAAGRWLARQPPFAWIRSHFGRQLHWLGKRFDPRIARGLSLTMGFLFLLVGVGAAGIVLAQVEQVRGIARMDFPALQWMAATRTDEAVLVARAGLRPFLVPWFLILTFALTVNAWRRSGWLSAVRAGAGMIGAGFGAFLLDEYVLYGVVPQAGFPSVPVAVVTSAVVHVTALVGRLKPWGGSVAAAAVGTFLACAVSLATLVAGWAAPSGIVLGFGLGLVWSTTLELATHTW